MKKNLKTLLGLGMAFTMAIAATTASFADQYLTASGSITANDLKMSLVMPTTATLAIKPYSAKQIQAGTKNDDGTLKKLYFANPALADGETEGVQYQLGITGYSLVATPKTSTSKMTVVTDATDESLKTSKAFDLSIKVGPVSSPEEGSIGTADDLSDDTIQTAIGTGTITETKDSEGAVTGDNSILSVQAIKTLTADYGSKSTTFTAPASSDTTVAIDTGDDGTGTDPVYLQPGQFAEIVIEGHLNTKATWEAGDKISVVPIFSITPSGYSAGDDDDDN